MNLQVTTFPFLLASCVAAVQMPSVATAQKDTVSGKPTLKQVKSAGVLRSSYRKLTPQTKTYEKPQANLKVFRAEIEPTLKKACYVPPKS